MDDSTSLLSLVCGPDPLLSSGIILDSMDVTPMPHCIVEYAEPLNDQIDVANLTENLFEGMAGTSLFDRATIKVRAISTKHFMTGSDKQLYMHTTVKLLPGRSPQQKEILGRKLLEIKAQVLADKAMLSVEVVDLSEAYFK